jgi:poly-gamma-glutamate capsule biosynthesis protein CapA/YwtB (metallophosphatase superfamily)
VAVRRRLRLLIAAAVFVCPIGCGTTTGAGAGGPAETLAVPSVATASTATTGTVAASATISATTASSSRSAVQGTPTIETSTVAVPDSFTFAFAGDVNFAERTATRLANDPATTFGSAAAELSKADLTMVNLETAVTTGGVPEDKSFTFRAPPTALAALTAAGVDLATMANNHAADYGATGLRDSLQAIADSRFPVIGIGANERQAYAPYTTTVHGLRVAVFAATQVHDHTLAYFTAGPESAGVAGADSDLLVQGVRDASTEFDVVVVYLHWGTEYEACPNSEQERLAATLAGAGATAVVGTHAHVLQGAGWRDDGVYVAYGLSNYLWWRSFGNEQDDSGVLTLTFGNDAVTAAAFSPSRLDDTGVPVPATGATRDRIEAEWEKVRGCADLLSAPPI